MKKNIHRVISTIVFFVLLVVAVFKCADVLEYKAARKKYTPFYESNTGFDVIYLGTSHVQNHILPMEIWKEYGIASYNWGYSNCTPAENYYLIKDILKYASPKVVVLDAYGLVEYEKYNNGKYRTDRIEQQHVQFDSLPISENKIEASKDVFDDYDHNYDFIWNFIMYHNRWEELGEDDFDYEYTTEKGATFLTGLGTSKYTPVPKDEKTQIDTVCYTYFLKIIEYCEDQGIQVLCTYLPFPAGKEQQRVANTIGDILEKYPGCTYVNMLDKNIIDMDTDINDDGGHLNYLGAKKVSLWLGDYLRTNYDLGDYSEDESWKSDYQKYSDFKIEKFNELTSLTSCLVMAGNDDINACLEVYDEKLKDDETIKAVCRAAATELKYVERDTDDCARLVATSKLTGDIVVDISFAYDKKNPGNIFSIKRVEEK